MLDTTRAKSAATASIYVLSDPRSGEVRYVGVTIQALAARYRGHLGDRRRNDHRTRWVQSLIKAGVKPAITEIDVVPVEIRGEVEQWWIAYFRQSGAVLTNATDGGLGAPGRKTSDEGREKLRVAALQRMQQPAWREAVSRVHKGKAIPPHVRAAVSEAATKRWADWRAAGGITPPETRARLSQAARARAPHPQTTEARAKVAEAKRLWWAEKRFAGLDRKTHCPRNHPYNEVNAHVQADGSWKCRICGRERARDKRRRLREASSA